MATPPLEFLAGKSFKRNIGDSGIVEDTTLLTMLNAGKEGKKNKNENKKKRK